MPRPQLLDHRGSPMRPARPASAPARAQAQALAALRAKYDAAQTTELNKLHWSETDGLSAAAANSPAVRKKLRERTRYERDNNPYLDGMATTLANVVVGTGPRLRLRTPDRGVNGRVEDSFEEWADAACVAEKLRTYREERCINGEGFLFLTTNPRLPTPVQLDLQGIEADQVATPDLFLPSPIQVDGIEFDRYGNPTYYHKLKSHPGDLGGQAAFGQYDRVPAELVLHWFKVRRSGQRRGVPEPTPALPLYALLRRFTLGTVTAAEMAALFAILIKTKMTPATEDEEGDTIQPWESFPLNPGMVTALPEQYEAEQMKPEHPATTFEMFERALIRQIARCLHVPYIIAAGDYSQVNYSSGRLGNQDFHQMVWVDRYHLETAVLDRIFRAWLAEARLAAPELVDGLDLGDDPRRILRMPRHSWQWDGFKHVDPLKEAQAAEVRMSLGLTNLGMECAADGYDWREVSDGEAEQRAYRSERGLPYPGDVPAPAPAPEVDPEAVAEAMARHPHFATNGLAHRA